MKSIKIVLFSLVLFFVPFMIHENAFAASSVKTVKFSEITKITSDYVYIKKEKYKIPKTYKVLFSSKTALTKAKMSFTYDKNKNIKSINTLEINSTKKATLQANGASITTIRVNSNAQTITNAKVSKLELSKKATTSFKASNVTASKSIVINGGKTSKPLSLSLEKVKTPLVEVNRNTNFLVTNSSIIKHVKSTEDVTVSSKDKATITKLTATKNTKKLVINTKLDSVVIQSKIITVDGSGSIKTLHVSGKNQVTINMKNFGKVTGDTTHVTYPKEETKPNPDEDKNPEKPGEGGTTTPPGGTPTDPELTGIALINKAAKDNSWSTVNARLQSKGFVVDESFIYLESELSKAYSSKGNDLSESEMKSVVTAASHEKMKPLLKLAGDKDALLLINSAAKQNSWSLVNDLAPDFGVTVDNTFLTVEQELSNHYKNTNKDLTIKDIETIALKVAEDTFKNALAALQ